MSRIKRITVSGFRGILTRLDIPFQDGGKPKSMILYGRNGTGKSSITDAWEWLTTGKIQNLAREGAEEGSYPHMSAKENSTFVEVEFADLALGTVRLTFDKNRVTRPVAAGNLANVRLLISHPCHIRHVDLTRFVLLTKAERYDALATLMGFVPQVEYQKALQRVVRTLATDLAHQREVYKDTARRHKEHFQLESSVVLNPLQILAIRLGSHGIECESETDAIIKGAVRLKQALVDDKNAKRLAVVKGVNTAVTTCNLPLGLLPKVKSLREAIGNLKAVQSEHGEQLLLIPLLQSAQDLISKLPTSGKCPLCKQQVSHAFTKHVKSELDALNHLKHRLEQVRIVKESLRIALAQTLVPPDLQLDEDLLTNKDLTAAIASFRATFDGVVKIIGEAKNLLIFDTTQLTDELMVSFQTTEHEIERAYSAFQVRKAALLELIEQRKKPLEDNTKRKKLVEDNNYVENGLRLIDELETSLKTGQRMSVVSNRLSDVAASYAKKTIEDVTARFDRISERVTTYFQLLEKDTPGLGAPRLRLEASQSRSVDLEVEFHGMVIKPAYKYLSESQLNSFGLSVSLASAMQFNTGFPFLILDDIVNSFDAEKRPKLIDLLDQEFSGVQILLMTHDRFWRDSLQKRFSNWQRLNFNRYEIGVGPICSPAPNSYERIEQRLGEDEVEEASSIMARYMEDALQDVCEAFEVGLKFNRRNEYTLDTLMNGLRVRLEDKLTRNHPIIEEMDRVTKDNAYRNWCIHCKNPESAIQASEVATVVANWKQLETRFHCNTCRRLLKSEKNLFVCGCGASVLQRGTAPA